MVAASGRSPPFGSQMSHSGHSGDDDDLTTPFCLAFCRLQLNVTTRHFFSVCPSRSDGVPL
ncbi:hypothetical protein KIN20_027012 [Parelaphostrongylus tenuis]|uniref:Uncharacterized protein n=1 Tax=Parelaphostrongylus tenuis TaxID=148309 RepID=A0AAD5QYS6_PARTN|nr:hypothetical protein KIN20_027012 [Parelaphostrongylus tenuis]